MSIKCISKNCPFSDTDHENCHFIDGCDFAVEQPTNADRIRAMSDEELVVFLDGFSGRCLDCAEDAKNKSCQIYKEGHYCRPQDIMRWLQQPVEEDDYAYLKPCPLCGGEAKLLHPCEGVHLVQCTCCGCGTTYTRTEIGAVRMWNRRFGVEN